MVYFILILLLEHKQFWLTVIFSKYQPKIAQDSKFEAAFLLYRDLLLLDKGVEDVDPVMSGRALSAEFPV